MSPHQKIDVLKKQERSYLSGSVALDDDQYVLYDDLNDEVHLLDEMQERYIEVYIQKHWKRGKWQGFGILETENGLLELHAGDMVRVKRRLPFALDEMLKELQDETFIRFITQLNALSFSPFDCIYSYNALIFLDNSVNKKGVSFYQFDNEDSLCAVQHHFGRGIHSSDRLEITTSLGKRMLICGMY
ncbi:DUF2777 family protein [Metabacillus herbersteinensis]|uniref:DUF2777 family protein n=1 Tax=Metabacillus herbersteinensis TaxID=283816 RepID=A0ABV6GFS6_9BACI